MGSYEPQNVGTEVAPNKVEIYEERPKPGWDRTLSAAVAVPEHDQYYVRMVALVGNGKPDDSVNGDIRFTAAIFKREEMLQRTILNPFAVDMEASGTIESECRDAVAECCNEWAGQIIEKYEAGEDTDETD